MKKLKTLLTLGCFVIAGYAAQAATIIVNSNILTNKTWFRTNTYILQGFIYVKNGATLTIQSGTIIKGDKATKGSLIIERGSQLIANGTVTAPIVFTSNQPVGSKAPGDWGGVILLGNAHVNQPGGTAIIEGGFVAPDGVYGGGATPNDAESSGSLKYIRIEYAGIAFQPNNEINGITFGGVGSGTVVEHIQVSYSGDDSFEFFGGAVNAKWLVSFRAVDDDFDTDFGYNGKLQFGVALRDPNVADVVSLSNGFESDNDATGSASTPITSSTFSNFTIVGGNPTTNASFNAAARLRRNTQQSLFNTILMGFPNGLHIDGAAAEANATNNILQFQNNIIGGCTNPLKVNAGSTFDIGNYVNTQGGNSTLAANNDVQLVDPFNLNSPNITPLGGSPALSGAAFSAAKLQGGFFTSVNYRGAFGTSDWTKCWTEWQPQNHPYSTNPINNAPAASITTGDPLTHCSGVNVTFNANSGGGLSYQWYKTNAIAGATSINYSTAAGGTYKVLVTNPMGCTKYSNSLTTVVSAPTVTLTNSNLSLCVNNPVVLNASSGTATGYQWTQNGVDIGGANGTSYNATATGTYAVRVTDGAGCTKLSSNKVVNATTPKPVITVNGASAICPPQTTQLTRTNVAGLTYQWQAFNGTSYTNIAGATGVNYTVSTPNSFKVRANSPLGCAFAVSLVTVIGNACRLSDTDQLNAADGAVNAYPNPFSDQAIIAVNLEKESQVAINIYDLTGKLVMEAVNGMMSEGENQIIISADGLNNGLYIAKVSVNETTFHTIKLSVQKN